MRHRFGLDSRDKLGRKVRGQTLNDVESWSRMSEQNLRVDKWSVCRG
jgi:hypothetical protein